MIDPFEFSETEFEALFQPLSLPKRANKAFADQDPDHFYTDFMEICKKGFFEPKYDAWGIRQLYLSEGVPLLQIKAFDSFIKNIQKSIELFEELYSFFKENADRVKPYLILNKSANLLVLKLLDEIISKLTGYVWWKKDYLQSIRLGELQLKFDSLLHTRCILIEGKKLSPLLLWESLGAICMHLADAYLKIDSYDQAKKYVQWFKKLQHAYPSNANSEYRQVHKRQYYELRLQLALKEDNFNQAIDYGLKANYANEAFVDSCQQPSIICAQLFESIMFTHFRQNKLKPGLFWAKLAKDSHEQNVTFCENVIFERLKYPINVDISQAEFHRKKINFFRTIIYQKKNTLINENIQNLQTLFTEAQLEVTVHFKKSEKLGNSYLTIEFPLNNHLWLLAKSFKKYGIICLYDNRETLYIYNLAHLDLDAINSAMMNWNNELEKIEERQLAESALREQGPITLEPIGLHANVIQEINHRPDRRETKGVGHEEPQEIANVNALPHPVGTKVIDWGLNHPKYEKNNSESLVYKR